jgi:hypothetical protein
MSDLPQTVTAQPLNSFELARQKRREEILNRRRTALATILEKLEAVGTVHSSSSNHWELGSVRTIDTFNGEYVSISVEQKQNRSSWRSDGSKLYLKLQCGYGRGCSVNYPQTKDGSFKWDKIVAKVLELTAARKAENTARAAQEKRTRDAKTIRAELAAPFNATKSSQGWYKIEHDYDCSYKHCLSGGPDNNFKLLLVGLTPEQVTTMLNYAQEQGILK